MLIDDVLVDRLLLTNFQGQPIDIWIELSWAADFADVFEIRGAQRRGARHLPGPAGGAGPGGAPLRGARRPPLRDRDPAGRGLARRHGRGAAGAPWEAGARGWTLHLEPAERVEVKLRGGGGDRAGRAGDRSAGPTRSGRCPGDRPGPSRSARAATHEAYAAWAAQSTRFAGSNDLFTLALAHAVADLKALTVYHFGAPVISAGIPWYTCPFGRDALITGFEALLATPEVARDALRFLARLQGERDDPEPRRGAGQDPARDPVRRDGGGRRGAAHAVLRLGRTRRRSSSCSSSSTTCGPTTSQTVEALLPAAERALGWLDRCADRDGDGLARVRAPHARRGCATRAGRTATTACRSRTATPAEPPIALVEVQGYAVDARRRMAAHLPAARAAARRRSALVAAARRQAEAIERALLDGGEADLRDRARSRRAARWTPMTSNAGHLLFSRRRERRAGAAPWPRRCSGRGCGAAGGSGRSPPASRPTTRSATTTAPSGRTTTRSARWGWRRYGMTREAGRGAGRAVGGGAALPAAPAARAVLRPRRATAGAVPGALPGRLLAAGVVVAPPGSSSLRAVLGLFPDAPRGTLHVRFAVAPALARRAHARGLRVGRGARDAPLHARAEGGLRRGRGRGGRAAAGAHRGVSAVSPRSRKSERPPGSPPRPLQLRRSSRRFRTLRRASRETRAAVGGVELPASPRLGRVTGGGPCASSVRNGASWQGPWPASGGTRWPLLQAACRHPA